MSIHNRDYMRDDDHRIHRVNDPRNWSVITWLIVINVAVYLLNNVLFYNPSRQAFSLSLEGLRSFQIWTPITYQFIHQSLWHLLGNMLVLFFLGRMLLNLISPRQILAIYLLGGLAGGALQLMWNAIFGDANVIGASGSALAVALALATLIPHRRITLLLFFVIPLSLTMRQMAWLLVGVNGLSLLFAGPAGQDGIAVMAHFGGMALGWAYIHYRWHERHFTKPRRRRSRERSSGFSIRILREEEKGNAPSPSTAPSTKAASFTKKPFVTSDVDAILDKINAEGFQSLTADERRILEESSKELSRRLDQDK